MQRYEYKTVPAPRTGEKARGVKSAEERFALTLAGVMNRLGREGWEYLRTDRLPMEARSRWGRRVALEEQVLLVFRRALPAQDLPVLAAEPLARLDARDDTSWPAEHSSVPRREPQMQRASAPPEAHPEASSPSAAPAAEFGPPLRRATSALAGEAGEPAVDKGAAPRPGIPRFLGAALRK